MNIANNKSKGDIIIIMNDDDYYFPNYIYNCVKSLDNYALGSEDYKSSKLLIQFPNKCILSVKL